MRRRAGRFAVKEINRKEHEGRTAKNAKRKPHRTYNKPVRSNISMSPINGETFFIAMPLRPLRKTQRPLPTGLAPLKLCEGEQAGLRLKKLTAKNTKDLNKH